MPSKNRRTTSVTIDKTLYEWAKSNKFEISTLLNAILWLLKETGTVASGRSAERYIEAVREALIKRNMCKPP